MPNPSDNQLAIANKAIHWFKYSSNDLFQISGGPGTGKSFLLHYIVQQLGLRPYEIAPMAYTGAAAIVMRRKGFLNAKTTHSWLLEPVKQQKKDKNGYTKMNTYFNIPEVGIGFKPKPLPPQIKLVVVDEGKMIPKPMRSLIERQGIKTIVAGDIDQLDPVAYDPAYFMDGEVHYLTEIFRQKENSAIVYLSQRIKNKLPIHCGKYSDCLVIYDDEVIPEMIVSSDVILCGRNDTRETLTRYIREDILGFDKFSLPHNREHVVCRQNNWNLDLNGINLANGLMGEIANNPDVSSLGDNYFTIDFRPMMLNEVFRELKVDKIYFNSSFKDKTRYKYNSYPNYEKFEYAYAITTHIAQGSEYNNGMYYEEYLNPSINTQLHYTGITRFSDYCIYVKKRRRLY